jgi:hypothetical protein
MLGPCFIYLHCRSYVLCHGSFVPVALWYCIHIQDPTTMYNSSNTIFQIITSCQSAMPQFCEVRTPTRLVTSCEKLTVWCLQSHPRTANLHVTTQPPALLPPWALLAISLHPDLEYQRSDDGRRLGIENGRPTPETDERRRFPPELVTLFGLLNPDIEGLIQDTSLASQTSRRRTRPSDSGMKEFVRTLRESRGSNWMGCIRLVSCVLCVL